MYPDLGEVLVHLSESLLHKTCEPGHASRDKHMDRAKDECAQRGPTNSPENCVLYCGPTEKRTGSLHAKVGTRTQTRDATTNSPHGYRHTKAELET